MNRFNTVIKSHNQHIFKTNMKHQCQTILVKQENGWDFILLIRIALDCEKWALHTRMQPDLTASLRRFFL